MTRVPTLATYQAQLIQMQKTQALLSNTTIQQSSLSITQDFKTIASTSNRVINLGATINTANNYNHEIDTLNDRLQLMNASIDGIQDIVTSMITLLGQYDSNTNVPDTPAAPTPLAPVDDQIPALASQAAAFIKLLQSDLNAQTDGRYIFSGLSAQNMPVDISKIPALSNPPNNPLGQTSTDTAVSTPLNIDISTPASLATSYYQGGPSPNQPTSTGSALSFSPAEGVNLKYGISADDPAFESIIRVLNVFQQFVDPTTNQPLTPSGSSVTSAIATLQNAQSLLTSKQADIATVQSSIADYKTQHTNVANLAITTSQNLLGIDKTETATQLSLLQTQLQASYSVFSNVSQLSLVNFLK